jgi:hypothetical protein
MMPAPGKCVLSLRRPPVRAEMRLHGIEITALPAAVAIARLAVRNVAVPDADACPVSDRLQHYFDLRISVRFRETRRLPGLNDSTRSIELQIAAADESIPDGEFCAADRSDARRLAAGDLFVPGAIATCRKSLPRLRESHHRR